MPFEKSKSFWTKPEGIVAILALTLIGLLLYLYAPFLLTLLQSTPGMIAGFVLGCIIFYILIDSKLRNMIWRGFQNDMRVLTSLFVKLEDPANPEKLSKRLAGNIQLLEGLVNRIQAKIQNLADFEEIFRIKGNPSQLKKLVLKPKKEIKGSKELSFQVAGDILQNLHQLLFSMGENSVSLYREMEKSIEQNEKKLQDENILQQTEELEYAIQLADNLVNSMDVDKGEYEAAYLLEWEKWSKSGQFLLADAQKIQKADRPGKTEPKKPDPDNKYKDLFNFD